jgi:hypothetical protein
MWSAYRGEEVKTMWLLSAAAIVLGLVVAIADAKIFMPPLHWFVLAIAISLLNPGRFPFVRRRT